jgi:hypothetical protein
VQSAGNVNAEPSHILIHDAKGNEMSKAEADTLRYLNTLALLVFGKPDFMSLSEEQVEHILKAAREQLELASQSRRPN